MFYYEHLWYTFKWVISSWPINSIYSNPQDQSMFETYDLPFSFKRLQFPIRLVFAITINKSQGQSLKVTGLGLDLTYECFSHGQFYVGMSRAMDLSKLYIVADKNGETTNVVYAQVLHYIILMNSMKQYGMLWYFHISRIPYHITRFLFSLNIFKS